MQDYNIDTIIPWCTVNSLCDPRKTKDFLRLSERVKGIKYPQIDYIEILNHIPKCTTNGVLIMIHVHLSENYTSKSDEIINKLFSEIKSIVISVAHNQTHPRPPKVRIHD